MERKEYLDPISLPESVQRTAHVTSSNLQKSDLLRLPIELRLQISEYVLNHEAECMLSRMDDKSYRPEHSMGYFYTCRTIFRETCLLPKNLNLTVVAPEREFLYVEEYHRLLKTRMQRLNRFALSFFQDLTIEKLEGFTTTLVSQGFVLISSIIEAFTNLLHLQIQDKTFCQKLRHNLIGTSRLRMINGGRHASYAEPHIISLRLCADWNEETGAFLVRAGENSTPRCCRYGNQTGSVSIEYTLVRAGPVCPETSRKPAQRRNRSRLPSRQYGPTRRSPRLQHAQNNP